MDSWLVLALYTHLFLPPTESGRRRRKRRKSNRKKEIDNKKKGECPKQYENCAFSIELQTYRGIRFKSLWALRPLPDVQLWRKLWYLCMTKPRTELSLGNCTLKSLPIKKVCKCRRACFETVTFKFNLIKIKGVFSCKDYRKIWQPHVRIFCCNQVNAFLFKLQGGMSIRKRTRSGTANCQPC